MLDQHSLDTLFAHARTHSAWLDKPVSDAQLHAIYALMKWGPTSANSSPGRIVFVKSPEAKARLLECVGPGNVDKVKAAPVTAIVAMDMRFFEHLPELFPHTDARAWFVGNEALIQATAFRNSSLQGAYLMLAARALGLDVGPMSGFDAAKLDARFFAGTELKANFLCNLGYGDAQQLHPRNPRLAFAQACTIA
ncbi:MAG TPA: malonic semialdehyde reductase [Telluria sp.]|jgi:nitroreductase|nr:malonic semialdehyde reductase [Telluria sp.]